MKDTSVAIDNAITQKFGLLELSPPTEIEQFEASNTRLTGLREALKLKGQLEQAEGIAKITKDDSRIKTEEYEMAKVQYEEVDADTKKCVDKIIGAQRSRRNSNKKEEEEKGGDVDTRRRGGRGGGQRGN